MNWGKAEILKARINNNKCVNINKISPSVDRRAILVILHFIREN